MDRATISIKQGSERNFGIVFSIVFLIFSFYPHFSFEKVRLWSLIVSAFFFLIAIFRPSMLKSLNFLWFRFGILLGRIISPIVMALVFVFAIIPTGIIIRLMGKDPLQRKFLKNKNSYWILRKTSRQSMKNQF